MACSNCPRALLAKPHVKEPARNPSQYPKSFLDSEKGNSKSGYEESVSSVVGRGSQASVSSPAVRRPLTNGLRRPAGTNILVIGSHASQDWCVEARLSFPAPFILPIDARLRPPARLSSFTAFRPPVVAFVASSNQQSSRCCRKARFAMDSLLKMATISSNHHICTVSSIEVEGIVHLSRDVLCCNAYPFAPYESTIVSFFDITLKSQPCRQTPTIPAAQVLHQEACGFR